MKTLPPNARNSDGKKQPGFGHITKRQRGKLDSHGKMTLSGGKDPFSGFSKAGYYSHHNNDRCLISFGTRTQARYSERHRFPGLADTKRLLGRFGSVAVASFNEMRIHCARPQMLCSLEFSYSSQVSVSTKKKEIGVRLACLSVRLHLITQKNTL